VIRQGDVFWVNLPDPQGSGPWLRRPVIIVQNDAINRSAIRTTIVCVLTGNLRLAEAPGNVLLARGEANIPKRSVANVTQIATLDKNSLAEKIGTLPRKRLVEVLQGVQLVLSPILID